ncbi:MULTISPECIES: phage tail protein [Pseudomonas]|uniref:Oxidoreductase n=1 Tax=Pseudomonas putida TaxID=303 RepID=A0A1L7N5V4_PSEPU|nr:MULTISPECIES: phage tail protein [Pseudomonas]MBK4990205.1 phage tail protein [Pseudomonas sp. S36]MBP2085703.1 phage protein U [Pseudomonas sp. PvP089]MBP2088595.1 phage protein U [Pseudomonas sp. PvP088]MBP2225085.1 phage protein U [Pseudomonas putida]MCE0890586.1 phage tail protein [Pseudomonas alloputida]
MMLALGMFIFSLPTLAYQQLQRQTDWRHAANSRIGAQPARQYLGRGEDDITLPGVLLPELAGSMMSLDEIRAMANTGKAWALVEGTGRVYGLFIIESLSETRSVFFQDGTARRIEFSLTLKRVDDGRVDLMGAVVATSSNILRALL